MELKKAVAVCLISLFSATLVVLIARSLDSQAAARLEPQLARIVEELEAIRKQGGIAVSPRPTAGGGVGADGVVVYYFHGNTRCPACQSIESQAKQVVQTYFAPQLAHGAIVWKVLNYEQPANAELVRKFDIQSPVVVLARWKDGKIETWNRLDEVWALVGDKPAYAQFLHDQIARMLAADAGAAVAQFGPAGKPGPGPSSVPSDGAVQKPSKDQAPPDPPVP